MRARGGRCGREGAVMIDGVKRAEVLLLAPPHAPRPHPPTDSYSTPIRGGEGRRGSEASPRSQTTGGKKKKKTNA